MRKKDLLQRIESLETRLQEELKTIDILVELCGGKVYQGGAPGYLKGARNTYFGSDKLSMAEIRRLGESSINIANRLCNVEREVRNNVTPFVEREYRYGIEANDEGTLDWAVGTDGPGAWNLTITDGTAETHAEAWAAIKEAVQADRDARLEDRAFNNMSETGTVKW